MCSSDLLLAAVSFAGVEAGAAGIGATFVLVVAMANRSAHIVSSTSGVTIALTTAQCITTSRSIKIMKGGEGLMEVEEELGEERVAVVDVVVGTMETLSQDTRLS